MLSVEGEANVLEKGLQDVEMLVDNSHFCLEKVEDRVDGFVESIWCYSQTSLMNYCSLGSEIQRVQREWRMGHENLLLKFSTNNDIIDKKFVCLDEELERVVDLVGQKIDVKFREFSSNFMEAMEIKEMQRKDLEAKVASLEARLEHSLAHTADLAALLFSLQSHVQEVEDAVMADSEEDANGDEVRSSSSSDFGPVENMVAIPVPVPSVIHTLIPVDVPEVFIPPSLHLSPSPLYVEAWEEDPIHDGVLEYWVVSEDVPLE